MVRKCPPTLILYLQRAGWGVCPHPGVLLRQDSGDQSTGDLQPGPEFNINDQYYYYQYQNIVTEAGVQRYCASHQVRETISLSQNFWGLLNCYIYLSRVRMR